MSFQASLFFLSSIWTSVNIDREWQAFDKFRTPRWRRKKQNNRFVPFFYLRRLTSSSTKMKRQTNFVFLVIRFLLIFPSREIHQENYDVDVSRALLRWPETAGESIRAALSTHPRCAFCRARSCSSRLACFCMIFFSLCFDSCYRRKQLSRRGNESVCSWNKVLQLYS